MGALKNERPARPGNKKLQAVTGARKVLDFIWRCAPASCGFEF
jgi:hypothetical protein